MDAKQRMVFVVRHAESLEDVDNTAYERIPDEEMPLSEKGRSDIENLVTVLLQNTIFSNSLQLILSPSKRVLETAEIVVSRVPSHIKCSLITDSLIQKQNWGKVTVNNRSAIEKERYRIGVLRYRFPGGESGNEMLFRFRIFAKKLQQKMAEETTENILIITHGFGFRVLLKVLLNWTEEYFESLAHPQNCELKRLIYENGSFTLLDKMRVIDSSKNPNFIKRES